MVASGNMWQGSGSSVRLESIHAGLVLAACSGAAPQGAKSSGDPSATVRSDASPSPCATERSHAAALFQASEAMAPPALPDGGDRAQSMAFIRGPMADWVRARRTATDQADAALASALACTPRAEQASLLLQAGRLQTHFVAAFLRTGESAIPALFAADAEIRTAYVGSLLDAVAPQLERARRRFEECKALPDPSAPADVSACVSELAALPERGKPGAPAASSTSSSRELKPPPRVGYSRPFVATTQPKPCTFAGTLKLGRRALSIGSREVARLEQAELSRLTLPRARAGVFAVETAWPVRGSFTLPAAALPFNLRSRVDLVAGHVWLSQGAAVSAATPTAGGALAYRALGAGAAATPDPAAKVACSELELAGGNEPGTTTGDEQPSVTFKGELSLSAEPSGPTIATLTLREPEPFTLLGRQGAWLHIQNSSTPLRPFGELVAYDFDGWTEARPTDETGFGMIGLLEAETPPSRRSTAELALFADPSRVVPIGKLVQGVPVLLGEAQDGFVNVIVPGLDAVAADRSGFWAEKGAAEASLKPL